MNILDKSTRAMLDTGKVAVLDGGYIVLTPGNTVSDGAGSHAGNTWRYYDGTAH